MYIMIHVWNAHGLGMYGLKCMGYVWELLIRHFEWTYITLTKMSKSYVWLTYGAAPNQA